MTENLREKINMLNNMIQADDLQSFQAQLLIDAAQTSTGDPQVDQAMQGNASNARAQLLQCNARLTTYRATLKTLNDELNAPK
jgi:hypothetical protein